MDIYHCLFVPIYYICENTYMEDQEKPNEEFIYSIRKRNSLGNESIEGIKETPVNIISERGETRVTSISRILKGLKSGDLKLKRKNKVSIIKEVQKKFENEEN